MLSHFKQGAYTAEGQIINLVVVHAGEIEDDVQDANMESLSFVTSDEGDLSFDAVWMSVQEVYRYCCFYHSTRTFQHDSCKVYAMPT